MSFDMFDHVNIEVNPEPLSVDLRGCFESTTNRLLARKRSLETFV